MTERQEFWMFLKLKIEKIHMNSEKLMNSCKIKKDKLPDYLLINYFLYQFVSNFLSLLLCKINILDFLDV